MDIRVNNLERDFTPSEGSNWTSDDTARTLRVTALPNSDIFVDPGENESVSSQSLHNAATLMTETPSGDFQFGATTVVDFGATFDAGVLLLRVDEFTWAKLCFEYSPDQEPMIVSVVNNGSVSDDANAFVVRSDRVRLRISRKGRVYAFHASVDEERWVLVRAFAFDSTEKVHVGFEAQSPNGGGCDVVFSDIFLSETSIGDFRDGN